MGEPGAGGFVPLTRRFSGIAVGLAFFAGPGLLVSAAISARTAGVVDSRTTVEARVARYLRPARAAAEAEGVPLALVLAVASAESSGRPDARSSAGAVGLMQILPSTAADMASAGGEPSPVLTDPATSLRLGARYLAAQRRAFAGEPAATELALCAYNAGPGAVRRWLGERPLPPGTTTLGTWIPPTHGETRNYVRRVLEWEARWSETLAAAAAAPASAR